MAEVLSSMPRQSNVRLRRLLVVALVLCALLIFLLVWKQLAPGNSDLVMRDQPGARALYLDRKVAQHLLAVARRVDELTLTEGEGMRIEGHALYRVENEDWRAACDLLLRAAPDLRALAIDGQAGARAEPAAQRLVAMQNEADPLRLRFAEAEMLRRGRLPEEMFAFLVDFCSVIEDLKPKLR